MRIDHKLPHSLTVLTRKDLSMRNLASVTAIILLISSRWGGKDPFIFQI